MVVGATAYVINHAGARAVREPTPAQIQAAVKAGVLGLVWLDVGMVASVRGPWPALAVAALWLPAFLLGRWLYST
jgi:4-hydroxybenzoate polyprenyltransferase